MRYQDTINYKVVRTSEEPVELVNGTQTGVYDVGGSMTAQRSFSSPRL